MKLRKIAAITVAVLSLLPMTFSATADSGSNTVNITVDTQNGHKAISPYIYGVNAELMDKVSCGSVRAGGNRYTAYNWETNASNAGSDYKNISDGYFQQSVPPELKDTPGCAAIDLLNTCNAKGAYPLMTLQLAGYVAADFDGEVTKEQAAPSDRWNKVELTKGSEFSLTPDLNDDTVYMDEFVNYLVKSFGDSQNGGIRGYSLDNEPALWRHTHSLIHPKQTTCEELLEKSIEMSKAVKAIDPNAEIFGPSLFGYNAFTGFSGAPDWLKIKNNNPQYRWFIDYYLDEMKKAEDESGVRLLDVLDVHFYTEAKGVCGERKCRHYNDEECLREKYNSTRSLWDDSYSEISWITDTGAEFLPILPNLQESVDKFYPGTKIAITEYDFGGANDVAGAIMEADALGIFAQNEIYCANLFTMDAGYQLAAINLYTDYDGNGNGFGDTLVSCEGDNPDRSTSYAAINGENTDVITLIVTNKSSDENTVANITLPEEYSYVHAYGINNMAAQVFDFGESNPAISISGNKISYDMKPKTVSMLVIGKDKAAVEKLTQTTDSSSAESSSDSEEKEKEGVSIPLIAGIGGGVLAIAAAAVVIIIKKRR